MVHRRLVLSNTSVRHLVHAEWFWTEPFGIDQMSYGCVGQDQMSCKKKDISWILYLGNSGVEQALVMVGDPGIQTVMSRCQTYFSFSIS